MAALARQGQFDAAAAEYRKALALKTDYAEAHRRTLAIILVVRRRIRRRHCANYREALKIDQLAEAHSGTGTVLARRGDADEAIAEYRKAVEIKPDYVDRHGNLGDALALQGKLDEAIEQYLLVLRLKCQGCPGPCPIGRRTGAARQVGRGDFALPGRSRYRPAAAGGGGEPGDDPGETGKAPRGRDALARSCSMRRPTCHPVLNALAWLMATSPEASIRNGTEAVELAGRANKLVGGKVPEILDTLAAGYAEAGDFSAAMKTAQRGPHAGYPAEKCRPGGSRETADRPLPDGIAVPRGR